MIGKVCHSRKMPWGQMSTSLPGPLSRCPLKPGSWGLRSGAEIWDSHANTIRIKFSATGHRQDGSPGWGKHCSGARCTKADLGGCTPTWLALGSALRLKGLASCVCSDASLAVRPGGCRHWGRGGVGSSSLQRVWEPHPWTGQGGRSLHSSSKSTKTFSGG